MAKTKRHTLYNELKGELYKRNITYAIAAKALNITTNAFNNKINGPSDFTVNEAIRLCRTFGMDPIIIFNSDVQNATEL